MSASNYPPGLSDFTPGTPWNEPVIPERKFEVTCSQSLSRTTSIWTDDYCPEYDEETGHTYANTLDTNWNKAYSDSAMTPLEIINAAGKIAKALLEQGHTRIADVYLKSLVDECEGWNEDETEIVEN